jgi:hypothetical protein
MRIFFTTIIFILCSHVLIAAPLKNGKYAFTMKWAEHPNMAGAKVTLVIKNESVTILLAQNTSFGKKGEVLEKGKLFYHKKFKVWLIAEKPEDYNCTEYGGCSDGPTYINFKKKIYWTC